MPHSPSWEANGFSASQEIPRIFWKWKVHCCIHKSPSPVPILSQINPVHVPSSHFLKILSNIIPPSTPGYSKWSLSLRFPHQNPVYTSPYALHAPPISFFSIFITQTIFGEQYRSLSSSVCSFLHSPVTSSLLGANILYIVLYTLIFWIANCKTKDSAPNNSKHFLTSICSEVLPQ